MYLKSLKLAGFKSFADRTRLEFRSGVTVVVGPNGAGKSNLVDAVSWVMGTQSTRSLRTEKMDDVIFAGTAARPGLSRAEVTLVFDNADRLLPLDLPEVAITRRLYRDGQSEYEINGIGCRLLDVADLLADSGVGRHQHVIVGQGQIESVLNTDPEAHRQIIEEAAGILKHRLRKERALRRLERTDADLTRLRDLLGEINRQMRPLKRQAEAANRHQEVAARVGALTIYLGGRRLLELEQRRASAAADEAELSRVLSAANTKAEESAASGEVLATDLAVVNEELGGDTAAAARLETTLERLRRIAAVAGERRRAGMARLEGMGERRRDLEGEAADLDRDLVETIRVEAQAVAAVEQRELRLAELEDELRSVSEQEALGSGEGAVALIRGDVSSLEAAAQRDQREDESVARRLDVLASEVADDRAESRRLLDEIRRSDEEMSPAQLRYQQTAATRRNDQSAWEAAEAAYHECRLAAAAAAARQDALAHLSEEVDGDTVDLLAGIEGVLGPLSARLAVPPELAAAVAAALAEFAEGMAVDGRSSLELIVSALKSAGRGGVALVAPLSPGTARAPARDVAPTIGMAALVDRLGDGADRELAAHLLGDVVLAEGWSGAWKVVQRHPELRAVTPEGDLFTSVGVRVARPDGATPAMLEAARQMTKAADIDLARAQSRLSSARRAFEAGRDTERLALEALESLEAGLSGATDALGRLQRLELGITQETARLEERRAALASAAAERRQRLADLSARLAALEGEEDQQRLLWSQLAERRQDLGRDRDTVRSDWQVAVEELGAVRERRSLLEARGVTIRAELQRGDSEPLDGDAVDRLARVEQAARLAIDGVREKIDALRRRQSDLRARSDELSGAHAELERRYAVATAERTATKDRLAEVTLELTELRLRTEAVAEGLRRDADVDEAEAMAAPRPEFGEGEDLEALLTSAQAELRRMGLVNPLALEEFRRLEERHRFLADQLDDLERSREELRKVIHAVEAEMETMFTAAFSAVAAAYEENFALLFPGGRGRLRLTEPDQALSSGVEIEAQPLGKRVGRLSLLSGGERSMAALAFLFAVFKARPSPFYILDEVEAALDDTNLRRFLRLVDAFRGSTQLVIITHQQQTMEAADLLYGVTMEPGGSSQVLAKAMSEVGSPV